MATATKAKATIPAANKLFVNIELVNQLEQICGVQTIAEKGTIKGVYVDDDGTEYAINGYMSNGKRGTHLLWANAVIDVDKWTGPTPVTYNEHCHLVDEGKRERGYYGIKVKFQQRILVMGKQVELIPRKLPYPDYARVVTVKGKKATQAKATIPAAKKPKAANQVAQLKLPIAAATDKTNYTEGKLSEGYPGNKSQAYQRIINQIPPHEVFYSGFAGKCTIATKKKPATRNIVTDLYDAVLPYWKQHKHIHALHESFFAFIEQITWSKTMGQQWCIYLDPPYLKEARKSGKDIYTHELTPEQHEQLIKAVLHISNVSHTHILISHPPVPLYETLLQHGWRKITYEAPTHRGTYTDALYMNYPEPEQLHEYTYLGTDFTQRQQIKRKKTALAKKLAKLPALERNAVLDYLHNYFTKQ